MYVTLACFGQDKIGYDWRADLVEYVGEKILEWIATGHPCLSTTMPGKFQFQAGVGIETRLSRSKYKEYLSR